MASGAIKMLGKWAEKMILLLDKFAFFAPFTIRLWIANVFFQSGLLKLPEGFLGIGQGNWDTTLYLFTSEHPVPFMPPEVAAFIATGAEVLGSLLLALGFGGRIWAAVFIVMTGVIQFTYKMHPEHFAWMIMLFVIVMQGPGKLSIDHLLRMAWMKK